MCEECFAAVIERFEGKTFFESAAGDGVADHVFRSKDDESGGGVFQNALEAEPGAGRSFANLIGRRKNQVEHDDGKRAVMK